MNITEIREEIQTNKTGAQMHRLIKTLYPICRSITGDGLRESLRVLQKYVPLTLHEVPSGTRAFDWTVPKEWNVRDAYVKNPHGEKVISFQESNLHLVNYSIPVRQKLPLEELKRHLYSLPDHPDWIPYKTSYYQEAWGFCVSHHTLMNLEAGEYEVCIDAALEPGHLTYGEYYLEGKTSDEILFSCHCCHPSLCNDNLSGMALATFLAAHLTKAPRRYSYRFLFIPGTIGAIVWLSRNEHLLPRIKHGLVIACVGDAGHPTYKRSRRSHAEIDRAAEFVLEHCGQPYEILDFSPYGYDERQYCSPGFNLPVGSLTRTPYGRYPEYHTSADDLAFIQPESLADSLSLYLAIVAVLEGNQKYRNTNPKCEPQLGKRGLYRAIGGKGDTSQIEMALFWVLNYSDGTHTLLDIAEKSGCSFEQIHHAAGLLLEHGLLEAIPQP